MIGWDHGGNSESSEMYANALVPKLQHAPWNDGQNPTDLKNLKERKGAP